MRLSIIKQATAAAFLVGAFMCQSANAVAIDKIVMFGDSLSDNGNVYALTKAAHDALPIIPIIPQSIYYKGRFSNGPVWVEDLAKSLNVELVDYAYAGAWAEPIDVSKLSMPINLSMQVNFFLVQSASDTNKEKHLYVIWIGGNDYIKGRSDVDFATTNTVGIIKEQIDWLRTYGAKNFLVLSLPDISRAPQVVAEGDAAVENAKELMLAHNSKLAQMLSEEQAANPGDKLISGDLAAYMGDVVTNPAKYNLKNVNDACFDGGYFYRLSNGINAQEISSAQHANIDIMNNPSLREAYMMANSAKAGAKACANPDEYFFWDHLHPTRMLHQLISTTSQQILSTNDITGKDSV